MASFPPNFNDPGIVEFCTNAGKPTNVGGFVEALKTITGATSGSIDDLWRLYIIDVLGEAYVGQHPRHYGLGWGDSLGFAEAGYNFRLTNPNDDGREYQSAFDYSAPLAMFDFGVAGSGMYPAWSFPNVQLTGNILSATLELTLTTGVGSSTFSLYGESNAVSPSANWSTAHRPYPSTKTTARVLDEPIYGGTYTYQLDVTGIVNEILGGAGWISGGRMNFWAEAAVGEYAARVFYATPTALAARLEIRPETRVSSVLTRVSSTSVLVSS